MSSKDTYERISVDIVAAARATFAKGRRTEAIEMLRRFDLGRGRGKAAVAEALRELMAEHQRLTEEERRVLAGTVDEHLNAAEALLANGQVQEAWARACDAVQADPRDERAIALEVQIRKALDEQLGRAPRSEPVRHVTQPAPDPAPPHREREEVRSEPGARRPDPAPAVNVESSAMASRSRWWVVAAIVVLVALIGLAARAC